MCAQVHFPVLALLNRAVRKFRKLEVRSGVRCPKSKIQRTLRVAVLIAPELIVFMRLSAGERPCTGRLSPRRPFPVKSSSERTATVLSEDVQLKRFLSVAIRNASRTFQLQPRSLSKFLRLKNGCVVTSDAILLARNKRICCIF